MAEFLVVIPTYNEAESIAGIIERTRAAIPSADILVVDDASPDGTGGIVEAMDDTAVHLLTRPGKDGLGRAYVAGFRWGLEREYRFLAEMDADGSHDPADLPAMLATAIDRADLVIGSRWVTGGSVHNWPRSRRLISRVGNVYSRWILGSRIHDITAGFRVYRAAAASGLVRHDIASQGYCFQVETAWRLERSGAVVVEHPISFTERVNGSSKMHTGIVVEALLRVTGWGLTRPFRSRDLS